MCISVFVIILSIFLSSVLVVAQKKEEANRTNLFVKENEVKTLFEEYDSYQVEFNWKPASKRTYVYTSKAPNIATVNEKGVITPIAKGQTEIRADYEKNGKKYFDILKNDSDEAKEFVQKYFSMSKDEFKETYNIESKPKNTPISW